MNDIFSNVPIDLVSHVIATNANVYNKLIADRNALLEKLNEKERQLKALFDTNEKLRTEITELNIKIQLQNDRIAQLESENKKQAEQIKNQADVIANLVMDNKRHKVAATFNKILYAIQDLNAAHELEKNGHPYLKKLRVNRINGAHYFLEDDLPDIIKLKNRLVHDQLLHAINDNDVYSKFKKEYRQDILANMLAFTKTIINTDTLIIDEYDEEHARSWWE
jgi:uncharacterized protein YoxC